MWNSQGTCSEGDVIGRAAMLDDHFHLPQRHVSSVYPKGGDGAVVVLWAVECVEALASHEQAMVAQLVLPAIQQMLRRLATAVQTQLKDGLQWRRDEAQLRKERKGAWEQELRAVLQQLEAEAELELTRDDNGGLLGLGDDGGDASAGAESVDRLVNQLASKRQAALLLEQSQKLEALVFNAEVRLYASIRLTAVFDADADVWHGARRVEVLQTTSEVRLSAPSTRMRSCVHEA
jgi:hypothetical protein